MSKVVYEENSNVFGTAQCRGWRRIKVEEHVNTGTNESK